MKKIILFGLLAIQLGIPLPARADLFGGDLPLLAEIVMNTLQTLRELEAQTSLAKDELRGVRDKISRMKSIADLVQPNSWQEWKDPREALKRLRTIFTSLPEEYRTDRSEAIEREIAAAFTAIGQASSGAKDSFQSGKELERLGAEASPGVAQKLAASGTGTLVAMAAQQQVLTSHITSLLTQMLVENREAEARSFIAGKSTIEGISRQLSQDAAKFSDRATSMGGKR